MKPARHKSSSGTHLRRQWCGFLLLICGTFVLLFIVVLQYSPAPPVLARDDDASLQMGPLPEEETHDDAVAPEAYPRGNASEEAEGVVRCETLVSVDECARHAHCTPIQGDACAAPGTVDKASLFGHCVSSVFASTYSTKKMKLRREVPEWMSSHPDHSAICARPSGSGGPAARFTQKIIPPGWVQQKCVDCCVPPEPVPGLADQSLAIIVTVQDELASLANALKSWQRHGLLDYAQERYLNIDGGDADSRNKITGLARSHGFTVFTSETSQGISSALARLMQAVKSPFVLLLEKDWKLVESRATVFKQLNLAKRLMFSRQNGSRTDLVKFRSRWNFGFPNVSPRKTVPPDWDIGVSMVRTRASWEPHLFCNIYHYQSDAVLLSRYPNRMWRCGCDFNYWCLDSGQCGWTNNPIMFRRKWWLDMMHGIAQKHRNKVFEFGTYYSDEWLLPHWVVAESDGLFTHDEIGEGHERKYI